MSIITSVPPRQVTVLLNEHGNAARDPGTAIALQVNDNDYTYVGVVDHTDQRFYWCDVDVVQWDEM